MHTKTENRAGKMTQGAGPEFKLQYHKKKKKKNQKNIAREWKAECPSLSRPAIWEIQMPWCFVIGLVWELRGDRNLGSK
jgi:hypothetical protein